MRSLIIELIYRYHVIAKFSIKGNHLSYAQAPAEKVGFARVNA